MPTLPCALSVFLVTIVATIVCFLQGCSPGSDANVAFASEGSNTCSQNCNVNGDGDHSCMSRIQWKTSEAGGSMEMNEAYEFVNKECTGQCSCSPPKPGESIKVISLNLADGAYGGKGCQTWQMAPVVAGQMPFNLGGFQEPRGELEKTLDTHSGDFEVYQSALKHYPTTNPAPIAWSKPRLERLSNAEHEEVARDGCGSRVVEYVKLRDTESGKTVFFANTHGPTSYCNGGSTSGQEYDANLANVIKARMGDSDVVIVTGDFNAGSGTFQKLSEIAPFTVGDGIDFIFSNVQCTGGKFNGGCSDHAGVQATCNVR